MRLVYLDKFSNSYAAYNAIPRMNGFKKAGIETFPMDTRFPLGIIEDMLVKMASSEGIDVLFFIQRLLSPEFLQRIKEICSAKIILMNGDIERKSFQDTIRYSKVVDTLLVCNNAPEIHNFFYRNGFTDVREFHASSDVSIFCPKGGEKEYDVIFSGHDYSEASRSKDYIFRRQLLEVVNDKYRLKIAGSGWPEEFDAIEAHSEAYASLASKAKIQLVINGYGYLYGCFSSRTWNALACGIPVLHYDTFGIEEYFPRSIVKIFNGVEDCLEEIESMLLNPTINAKMALRARKFIAENHTFLHRAFQIKRIAEEK